MDYKSLIQSTIEGVKWATHKEDEIYGGEVLSERLSSALMDAGVDIETRLGFPAWYGASDEIVMNIVLAFIENEAMNENEDAAISRIQSDLYDALNENPQLEEIYPDFWAKTMSVL